MINIINSSSSNNKNKQTSLPLNLNSDNVNLVDYNRIEKAEILRNFPNKAKEYFKAKNKYRTLQDRKFGCSKGHFNSLNNDKVIGNNFISQEKAKRLNSSNSFNNMKNNNKNSNVNFYNSSNEVYLCNDNSNNNLFNNPYQDYFVKNKYKQFFV